MAARAIPVLEEYKLCEEKAERLDGFVWQTASILGGASAAALVRIASDADEISGLELGLASIVGVTFALVWWRFARRWWSIQWVLYKRMEELDREYGSRMAVIVREWDDASQLHRLHLRKRGTLRQRATSLYLALPTTKKRHEDPERGKLGIDDWHNPDTEQFEYRGMRESARLLVWVLVGLWALLYVLALVSTWGDPEGYSLLAAGAIFVALLGWQWRKK
jgi:hypothetical protein